MRRDAGGDLRCATAAGRDDRVDAFRAREPLDGELVLDRDDRPAVCVAEARSGRVAIGYDDGQAPAPRIREDTQLRGACPEDEEARHTANLAIGSGRKAA